MLRMETLRKIGDCLMWEILALTGFLTFIYTYFSVKPLTVQDHLYVENSPQVSLAVPANSVACSVARYGSSPSCPILPSLPVTSSTPLQISELDSPSRSSSNCPSPGKIYLLGSAEVNAPFPEFQLILSEHPWPSQCLFL